jgi:hypothetical protein
MGDVLLQLANSVLQSELINSSPWSVEKSCFPKPVCLLFYIILSITDARIVTYTVTQSFVVAKLAGELKQLFSN